MPMTMMMGKLPGAARRMGERAISPKQAPGDKMDFLKRRVAPHRGRKKPISAKPAMGDKMDFLKKQVPSMQKGGNWRLGY